MVSSERPLTNRVLVGPGSREKLSLKKMVLISLSSGLIQIIYQPKASWEDQFKLPSFRRKSFHIWPRYQIILFLLRSVLNSQVCGLTSVSSGSVSATVLAVLQADGAAINICVVEVFQGILSLLCGLKFYESKTKKEQTTLGKYRLINSEKDTN